MKLRAKQDAQIPTAAGPRFVKGPQVSANDEQLEPGEVVDVPDSFVVNPQVWEVLTPPAGGQPVDLVEFDDDGMPKKRLPAAKKPQAAGAR